MFLSNRQGRLVRTEERGSAPLETEREKGGGLAPSYMALRERPPQGYCYLLHVQARKKKSPKKSRMTKKGRNGKKDEGGGGGRGGAEEEAEWY